MVTMSQKSSLPQVAKSVSQALMSDNLNVNGTGVDTLEGDRCDPLDHGSALNPLPGSVS